MFRRRLQSRELTGDQLVLTTRRTSVRAIFWLLFVALLGGSIYIGGRYIEHQWEVEAREARFAAEKMLLGEENARLAHELVEMEAALERASLDLEIGAVTQQELERQIVVLNEQLKQTREELEFLRNAGESD